MNSIRFAVFFLLVLLVLSINRVLWLLASSVIYLILNDISTSHFDKKKAYQFYGFKGIHIF